MILIKSIVMLLTVYLLGSKFLSNDQNDWWPPAQLFSSLIIGWLLLGIVAMTLGYAGYYSLFHYAVMIIFVYLVLTTKERFFKVVRLTIKDLPLVIVCLLSAYLLTSMSYPFGTITPQGVNISGAHYIDSTWHISLINSLTRSIPPENPLYSGTTLSNYHFMVDLLQAVINKFTGLSVFNIFFRVSPLITNLSLGFILTALVLKLTNSRIIAFISVAILLVGSNWYYLAPLYYPEARLRPSVAWVDLYSTLGVNLPLTFSLSLLCVIALLTQSQNLPKLKIIILSSTLLLIKSHTALVLLLTLTVSAIFKKELRITVIISIISVASLSYLIIGKPSSVLQVEPLWFIRTMYSSPEHLNYPKWILETNYLSTNPGYLGLTKHYLLGISLFLLINLGPLGIGLLSSLKKPVILVMFIIGFVLTHLFIYSKTAIVTIQFFYISIFACSLGLGIWLTRFKLLPRLIIGMTIWLSLLPGVYYTINFYQKEAKKITLGNDLVNLANYTSGLPGGTLLLDSKFRNGSWFTAISKKTAFLGDYHTLSPLGVDTREREETSQKIFNCKYNSIDLPIAYIVTETTSCLSNADYVKLEYSNPAGKVFRIL